MLLLFPKDQKADVAKPTSRSVSSSRYMRFGSTMLWLISQRPEDAEPFRHHR